MTRLFYGAASVWMLYIKCLAKIRQCLTQWRKVNSQKRNPSFPNLCKCFYIFIEFFLRCVAKGLKNYIHRRHCTALQRQNTEISKQIFPEKEYLGLSPNFHIHVSVSDLYIPTIGLPILLEEICRPILGLYKSLTEKEYIKGIFVAVRNNW